MGHYTDLFTCISQNSILTGTWSGCDLYKMHDMTLLFDRVTLLFSPGAKI